MGRTHSLDRWLYRGKRPNRLARLINGALARLAAAGIGPAQLVMLGVAGRLTGKTISFPVVVADYRGERYLVSMLGQDTNWVRNVRAASGDAVLRHGRREVIRLEEVAAGDRAAILRRYLECAPGARSHIPVRRGAPLGEFERVAARYPVFHVTVLEKQQNDNSRLTPRQCSPGQVTPSLRKLSTPGFDLPGNCEHGLRRRSW